MKVKTRFYPSDIALYSALLVMSAMSLFPFYWMLRSSFMTKEQIFAIPLIWMPKEFLYRNYYNAINSFPFFAYFRNTLLIVVMNIIGNVFISSLAAFGFGRLEFPGKKPLFALVLSTLMIPGMVLLIPQFLEWKMLGAYDTYVPLILPAFLVNAFFIFLVKQFFAGIPKDYDEAALIDGANYPAIYFRLMLPMSKPALATVGVFTFMNTWNDFLGPLIYIKSPRLYTLALGLMSFKSQYNTEWHHIMAVSTLVTIPMVLLYFFAQRYFVQGITFSGLKN